MARAVRVAPEELAASVARVAMAVSVAMAALVALPMGATEAMVVSAALVLQVRLLALQAITGATGATVV